MWLFEQYRATPSELQMQFSSPYFFAKNNGAAIPSIVLKALPLKFTEKILGGVPRSGEGVKYTKTLFCAIMYIITKNNKLEESLCDNYHQISHFYFLYKRGVYNKFRNQNVSTYSQFEL